MSITAADIMTRDVVTARPEDPVRRVAQLLADHDISAVPICDEAGALIGMLSEGDLMRPFGQENMLKRAWWLSLLAEGTDLAPDFVDYVRMDSRLARDLMTTPVISVSATTTLVEMAGLMTDHKIKRLPILQDGKLVGMVSRSDVVRAMARAPADMGAD
ncbi:MAG: CBS domain-containing protein [Proteobacteria bacterium]|nr:CBS domain-containing protein [Pseudomonadota bacterium]